ncbi:PH domain-containing protein [Methylophilus medardicus]|uniref:PH domain-containing protein n=1 Tax=Methylophilus medardicus TaxID=2588534 RepID=A0A5B8CR26_9PROT|nr:PH domain-containing protein [Methylophilus medardicus]QDC43734.1 PH domain-containing protein [Methylophilus medardicus]QDC48741.1 PH domain-containing protein [Methylophilus medardicus]QDC52446.1 PH domain-containing protein [Methylophilus medardicus]
MTRLIEGAPSQEEHIIYRAHVSVWSLVPLIILGLIFITVGVGLVFWINAYMQYKTTELAFTNKRVIATFGFIRRQTIELNINNVETVEVSQSIFGRLFNFGTLVIAGAGNPQASIPGISDPISFRSAFIAAQEIQRPYVS